MPTFRLKRRAVLKGAGSIAIALPWLEIMNRGRRANAQTTTTTPAKRFITVYQPGGNVRNPGKVMNVPDQYTVNGTDLSTATLSNILKPLDPVKMKLLLIDGLDMKCAMPPEKGEQHQGGIIAWLTGSTQIGMDASTYKYAKDGGSIDQLLAPKLSMGKRLSSIQMAVRWATGKSKGLISPINCANFEAAAPYSPIPPRLDPQQIFTDLFGSLMPTTGGGGVDANALALMRKKSILDFVDKKYTALGAKLGSADKAKLDQHLTKIREIETGINIPPPTTTTVCKQPTKVDTSDYKPKTVFSDDGSAKDVTTDAAIPKVGKFMMDMSIMALACDLTGVLSFQWSDTEAKHTFPWLNLSEHHHFYQHDGGFQPNQCTSIATWYSQQHLYFLQELQKVDMGGHTLLDESVLFFGTEISDPPTHTKTNMPFMLAGNGGGLKTGRVIKAASGTSHTALLLAILNHFGDMRTTLGTPAYVAPALTGLKG